MANVRGRTVSTEEPLYQPGDVILKDINGGYSYGMTQRELDEARVAGEIAEAQERLRKQAEAQAQAQIQARGAQMAADARNGVATLPRGNVGYGAREYVQGQTRTNINYDGTTADLGPDAFGNRRGYTPLDGLYTRDEYGRLHRIENRALGAPYEVPGYGPYRGHVVNGLFLDTQAPIRAQLAPIFEMARQALANYRPARRAAGGAGGGGGGGQVPGSSSTIKTQPGGPQLTNPDVAPVEGQRLIQMPEGAWEWRYRAEHQTPGTQDPNERVELPPVAGPNGEMPSTATPDLALPPEQMPTETPATPSPAATPAPAASGTPIPAPTGELPVEREEPWWNPFKYWQQRARERYGRIRVDRSPTTVRPDSNTLSGQMQYTWKEIPYGDGSGNIAENWGNGQFLMDDGSVTENGRRFVRVPLQ